MINPYHLQIITRQAEQGCCQSARALEEYERTGVLGEPPNYGQRQEAQPKQQRDPAVFGAQCR